MGRDDLAAGTPIPERWGACRATNLASWHRWQQRITVPVPLSLWLGSHLPQWPVDCSSSAVAVQ